MALFITEIHPSIREELDRRKKLLNFDDTRETNKVNTPRNFNVNSYDWSHGKMAWVQLTSNAILKAPGDGPDQYSDEASRQNNILSFGTLDENSSIVGGIGAYQNALNRPDPGITSVDIENKGELGSTRKAAINFTVWSFDQLELFEKLYMTPGVSLLLEWGWAVPGGRGPFGINRAASTDESLMDNIRDDIFAGRSKEGGLRAIRSGVYDAMRGPIVNFTWSVRPDGGFDCMTEIISLGSLMMDLNIHSKSKRIRSKPGGVERGAIEQSNIANTLSNIVDEENEPEGAMFVNNGKGGQLIRNNTVYGIAIDGVKGESSDIELKTGNTQYYVSWAYLEEFIVNRNLSFSLGGQSKDRESRTFELNSLNTLISNNVNLRSVDPYVCLLPGQIPGLNKNTKTKFKISELERATLSKEGFRNNTSVGPEDWISQFSVFPAFDATTSPPPTEFAATPGAPGLTAGPVNQVPGERTSGKLSNILINLEVIKEAHQNNERLQDFLIAILNSISDACGGIWDFGLQVDENRPNVLSVVDKNFSHAKAGEGLVEYEFSALINDIGAPDAKLFNIETKIPDAIKKIIFLGTNRSISNEKEDDYMHSKQYATFSNDVIDIQYKGRNLSPPNKTGDLEDRSDDGENEISSTEALEDAYGLVLLNRTDERVLNAKEALNKILMEGDVVNGIKPAIDKPLIPFDIEITIDGISGIYFGNVFSFDYMPQRYKDRIFFQVTNVKHVLNGNRWGTILSAKMRMKDIISPAAPVLSESGAATSTDLATGETGTAI